MIYESDDDDDLPLSKIYISTGCLLVPVFIVVWYYYTKRAFRKFFLRFLKNEPENENTRVVMKTVATAGRAAAVWIFLEWKTRIITNSTSSIRSNNNNSKGKMHQDTQYIMITKYKLIVFFF
jgi:hypothetical protein